MRSIEHIAAAIVLAETPGIGARRLRSRLEAASAGEVLADVWEGGRSEAGARWRDRRVRRDAERRALRFVGAGGRLVMLGDPNFPEKLARFPWAPGFLYLRGALTSWPQPIVTIVGTRRATPSALVFTRELAQGVAARGVAVASGLALGVDGAAHAGAIDGGGPTIAVVATGVDRCYPRRHRRLLERVEAQGLIVSELPPGTGPRAHQFPQRNRILAALADAVVVVQAPQQSGALITAQQATDADIEVLAVPGDPLLFEAQGSNRLLAAGARAALGVEDVVSAAHGQERSEAMAMAAAALLPRDVTAFERRLLRALDLVERDLDELARAVGLPPGPLMGRIADLEVRGWVECLPGGRVRLTPAASRADRWAADSDCGQGPEPVNASGELDR